MAFALRNLSVLAYAQGFTLWHYRAEGHPLADVAQPGFIDPARDVFSPGDMVMISAADGGRVAFVAQHAGQAVLAPLA